MALFLPGGSFKNNLGSTHKVEKVLSSLLSSITTFVLDLGCLFVFFWSPGKVQKLFWGLLM